MSKTSIIQWKSCRTVVIDLQRHREEIRDYIENNEFRKNLKVGDRVTAGPNALPRRNVGRTGVVVSIRQFRKPPRKTEVEVLFGDGPRDRYTMSLDSLTP